MRRFVRLCRDRLLWHVGLLAAVGAGLAITFSVTADAAGSRTWTYLALGDSNVYGAPGDCGHCTTYPYLVKKAITAKTGARIALINGSQHNKLTSSMLLSEIEADDWGSSPGSQPRSSRTGLTPRTAIAQSDLITITVGNNNLPWLADTDSCQGVYNRICRNRIGDAYASDLNGVLTQIEKLRAGKPTAVRLTTIYNDVVQGGYTAVTTFYKPPVLKQALTGIRSLIQAMNTRICQLAAKHHALCVDDYHIFNGPHGTAPMPPGSFTAKYGDLNQLGQNKIAAAIIKLGWDPLKIR
jgi:lysophospholipase L1-like esterase